MIQEFVDRRFEIDSLEREYRRKGSSFAIIYGRRRVGKTAIVQKFLEDKYGVYYLAEKEGRERNIEEFQKIVENAGLEHFSKFKFNSWSELFSHLCRLKDPRKMVIVIDEFPNTVENGVLVDFQKAWDLYLSKCNVFLILVGSSISMMERLTLDYASPLYGRRTMQLRVEKMKFWDAWSFMPSYSLRDFVRLYAVTDGIPYYILQMDPKLEAEENIKRNALSKDRILYEEAEFLLRFELREFRNYFPILKAIASGKQSFNEIANATSLSSASLSKYLKNLRDIGIVREKEPLFGKRRMRRYVLSDNYFSFWFGFVYPNRNLLELGYVDEVWTKEKNKFDTYVGHVFEEIVRDLFLHTYPGHAVGKWWNRRGDEIDLVAYSERKNEVYLGEVKFGRPIRRSDYENLRAKRELITLPKGATVKYILVAPEVFVDGDNVVIWDFRKIEDLMKNAS